jgi:hypothetical protein
MKDVRNKHQTARLREQLAQEAAKIMAEQMVRDYQQAKRKACERLGYTGRQALPGNDEIHAALQSYLAIFKGDKQPELLNELRKIACDAMRFLREFQPRLVGAVLNGTADEYSAVHLHVFADPEEKILQFLTDHGVAYRLGAATANYGAQRQQQLTRCEFIAGDTPVELSLFGLMGLREAPRSPVDGKPMRRADLAEVEQLLKG